MEHLGQIRLHYCKPRFWFQNFQEHIFHHSAFLIQQATPTPPADLEEFEPTSPSPWEWLVASSHAGRVPRHHWRMRRLGCCENVTIRRDDDDEGELEKTNNIRNKIFQKNIREKKEDKID